MNRLAAEKEAFSRHAENKPLPAIFHYWANKYLAHKLVGVTGERTNDAFYVRSLRAVPREKLRIVSIGSGAATVDIKVAKSLFAENRLERYECLELTPYRVQTANEAIREAGLAHVMRCHECDATDWDGDEYDGFVATHSLHHIEPLEQLFDWIFERMAPSGRFVTADMIGRNGHRCWPEVLTIVRSIWGGMPERYKFNHAFSRRDDEYDDRDWSTKANEGIRAQDILPLLLERFQFETFVGDGGVIDPFVSRVYGPNLSRDRPEDVGFIDRVTFLNDTLIDAGVIKPTMGWAVMTQSRPERSKYYRHWTAEFCRRV